MNAAIFVSVLAPSVPPPAPPPTPPPTMFFDPSSNLFQDVAATTPANNTDVVMAWRSADGSVLITDSAASPKRTRTTSGGSPVVSAPSGQTFQMVGTGTRPAAGNYALEMDMLFAVNMPGSGAVSPGISVDTGSGKGAVATFAFNLIGNAGTSVSVTGSMQTFNPGDSSSLSIGFNNLSPDAVATAGAWMWCRMTASAVNSTYNMRLYSASGTLLATYADSGGATVPAGSGAKFVTASTTWTIRYARGQLGIGPELYGPMFLSITGIFTDAQVAAAFAAAAFP